MKPLCERLAHEIPLLLPGFEAEIPEGRMNQLVFAPNRTSGDLFDEFAQRVLNAISNHYFPVYRMADGEFTFCVGRKARLNSRGRSDIKENLKLSVIRLFASFGLKAFSRISTLWGESYDRCELSRLRPAYAKFLRDIATHGCLAIHFTRTPNKFGEQYFVPICNWFDSNDILLNERNYVPFFFVYALMMGTKRNELFYNRRVLVVTSTTPNRKRNIEKNLGLLRVEDVSFMEISPRRSMLDRIDAGSITQPIDIVLVAAGIGAANIICQLAGLKTVCLDIGRCVEFLADPLMEKLYFFPVGAK